MLCKKIINSNINQEIVDTENDDKYRFADENVNERGKYYLRDLDYKGSYSEKMDYPITMPDGSVVYSGDMFGKPNTWRWSKEKFEWGLKNNYIVFKKISDKWKVYIKQYQYVDNNGDLYTRTIPYRALIEFLNGQGTADFNGIMETNVFSYPKSVGLILHLLKIASKTDSIILDFFSGSATTAHAVMQLNAEDGGNRKFICVQLPEPTDEKSEAYKAGYKNICEAGKERIRRAGEKINAEIIESNKQIALDEQEKKLVDVGFKVFKLDTSNIKKWNPDFDDLEDSFVDSINNLVDGRSELDLVYEIMLKYGLDLTYPVEELSYGDKKIYSIAFGMLVICVAEGVSKDVADFIVEYKKQNNIEEMRTVFKDGCFKDDSTQMSIKETLKSAGIEEFITI